MKKLFLFVVAAFCAISAAASEFRPLYRMNTNGNEILKNFSIYNHTGYASKLSRAVVDGVPAVKLTVTDAKNPLEWYTKIQLRLTVNSKIEACSEYRIRFRCRTDRVANFRFCCQGAVSPWNLLTEHRHGHVLATPDWQDVEYSFTATQDSNVSAWLPNFECGMLGKDNSLYITDLVVEALDAEKTTVIAKPDPQGMQVYCQAGFKVQKMNSTFNGSKVCGIYLENAPANITNASQVQYRFPVTVTIVKGASYRLSFYHKADKAAACLAQVQRGVHPWSMPSPQALRNFKTNTEWDYFEMNFTSGENYNKLMFLPNISIGLVGKGNTFYLRDVKFEKVD